ncbi:MAG: gfo/Idh/MocA family oxidoreductase [Chloroflexi bacterium]|nr:gfo/Idh/MocA family oxidoreductase [Chloroflexota bacterium]
MAKTIRWGIIGAGDVTEVKSGPGFQKARDSALVAVMRRDAAKARDFAQRHKVPRWYDNAEALIRDAEVDAVYVATPPDSHRLYTQMAAAAGKPVFVEKPMARNPSECQQMIDACQQANVPLWVAYYRRRLPRFLKIKALIESGTIGDIRTVIINYQRTPLLGDGELPWRVQPEHSGGGLFADIGVHMLDILDFLLGPIQSARGFAVNQGGHYPAEDNVVGSFRFISGMVGAGSWCFTSADSLDETILLGSKGQIAYSTFDAQPIRLTTAEAEQQFAIDNPPHVHQPLIQSIVDELNGTDTCPSTGDSGLRTAQIMDELLREYYGRDTRTD